MATKAVRDIIKIDEVKCDGCGACALSCAEGAIEIFEGKARLVSEVYCDGLGACIGECPQGALTIEKRESEEFDENAVEEYLESMKKKEVPQCGCPGEAVQQFERPINLPTVDPLPCGCPSTTVQEFGSKGKAQEVPQESTLTHWPVQLTLVPPGASFLQGKDLLIAAHCGPFAYGNFHQDFIKDHTVVCACPKLDKAEAHRQKLIEIFNQSDVKSATVIRMEVPCCAGLVHLTNQAIAASGKNIPLKEVIIGIKGEILS